MSEDKKKKELALYPLFAEEIVESLSHAFGGRSQWGPIELGSAVFGWHNNKGLANPEAMIREIARLEGEHWSHWKLPEEEEFYRDSLAAYEERTSDD